MAYVIVRHTVADYEKWRPLFDQDESRRRAGGGKGVNQVYRDVDNPNVVTIVMEWDNDENALKFTKDPALAEVMQKAGVVGRPAVAAIASKA
jgi:quinol monooxygenase YgiN